MPPVRALAALAWAILLSGCLSASDSSLTPSATFAGADAVFDKVRALLSDASCEAATDLSATSPNFVTVAKTPIDETMKGLRAAMTLREDARGRIALQVREMQGIVDVVDLTDPTAPRYVSMFALETGHYALDAKWSADGATAIVGDVGWIWLFDVRNLTDAKVLEKWQFPSPYRIAQAHMVTVATIAGEEWVFAASQQNFGVWIFKLVGEPDARRLEPVTQFLVGVNGPIGPHDQFVYEDPILKKPVLYIANGFMGWIAADVSDPASPQVIGGALNADPMQSYVHSVQATVIDGRRIVVTAAEVGVNALKVYEASDLLAPVLLAEWRDEGTNDPMASQHDFQIVGTRIYETHFERGLYVFDLATLDFGSKVPFQPFAPVARYSVGDDPSTGTVAILAADYDSIGGVLDVIVEDGILYLSDVEQGVVVVGDACLPAGDPTVFSLA